MSNQEIIKPPRFSYEDFTEGTAPFEYLYQYKDNKFVLEQLLQKLRDNAASVGVKSFVKTWNAYYKTREQEAHGDLGLNNATAFEGQELELFSGQYLCDDNGVTLPGMFGEDVVCGHPILPIKRLVNIDTNEERLELAYKPGEEWRHVTVEKTVLASPSKILELAGKGVNVTANTAGRLGQFLFDLEQLNYKAIPVVKSISRLGWTEEGFSPYVDGLVFDGEANYKHLYEAVSQSGEREKWVKTMKSFRAEKTIGRVFLAASFASVLLEPLGLLPFFVHAWGLSGTGKTVCLMAAASVWGNPGGNGLITTFNATDVGQEMVAGFLNNLPMCIDELQIQRETGVKDFDRMIYKLTEGKGKTRGARSGGLRSTLSWRNCMLTTGETPITHQGSAGGAVNRIIEFECYDPVSKDLFALAENVKANYGFAGKDFVEYLQKPGVMDMARNVQQNYFKELNLHDSTEKLAASASVILTADALATQLLFKDRNELTVDEMVELLPSKDDVDVNKRIVEFIYELVASHPVQFNGKEQNDTWGEDTGDLIYIIKSVFDQQLQEAGFNGASFLAWAKRRDMIICDKNQRTKKHRVNGGAPVRTVCLRRSIPSGFTPID